MAENKMLIDATHPEETRVVVLREGRVEEFDYESAARKLLRGSIFLAKITRVEPSLQAAFVDYGGNRHGFLAFNEIHPDYYQIPHADRQALIEEESAEHAEEHDDEPVAVKDDEQPFEEATDEAAAAEDDGADEAAAQAAVQTVVLAAEQAAASVTAETTDVADAGDAEDNAIDVTHLLPPEPGSDSAAAESAADDDAGADVVSKEAAMDTAAAPESGEAGPLEVATESADDGDKSDANMFGHDASNDEQSGHDSSNGEQSDHDATDGERSDQDASESEQSGSQQSGPQQSGPKTIAAATPPEERIVSDVVEHAEAADDAGEGGGDEQTTDDDAGTTDGSESLAAEAADGADAADHGDEVLARTADRDDEPVETETAADDDDGDGEDTLEAETEDDEIDDVGDTDVMEEVPARRRRRARNYKIQEVIKRRQVVLVQVVKEERGNKGAALTTYLSLAGRYTVLMPNTARGGGISRKITNIQDRKRLKAIAQELDVPDGMGLIIRTAGASRTKQEIKRDFEYLLRLWENVRDLTLQSTAPSLVYEEGDLIKRSIRDLYSKDVEQVLVAGEDAHKEAKSFMRMLMPSHAKNVVKYEDPQPLFARYRIEQQLNAMFSPFVQLRSGGYLVINQTEALVAVDVNSGKSTRKFSIEDTALNTNLEAAEELSRQLKLRDLAGLIVIDFIDMEEKRNNRAVERRLKECLRDDRARIQVGRISHFGLLEMSRQRLRTGVLEGSTMPCHHCQGTGIIRSTESVALAVLRALEDNLMSGAVRPLTAHCSRDVAMYLLNQKRTFVQEIESRYGVAIQIEASDEQQGADFQIERMNGGPALPRRVDRSAVNVDSGFTDERSDRSESREAERGDSDERRPRRRRRRRGRRGDGEYNAEAETDQVQTEAVDDGDSSKADAAAEAPANGDAESSDSEERNGRRRRRGRRGGRRNRGDRSAAEGVAAPGAPQPVIGETDADWEQKVQGVGSGTGPMPTETAPIEDAGTSAQADTPEAAFSSETSDAEAVVEAIVVEAAEAAAGAIDAAGDDVVQAEAAETEAADSTEAETMAEAGESETETETEIEIRDDAEVAAEEVAASDGAAAAKANGQEPAADDDAADSAPRGEPVAGEPVLERIVMTPLADGSQPEEEKADATPARKGWWQRRFGG